MRNRKYSSNIVIYQHVDEPRDEELTNQKQQSEDVFEPTLQKANGDGGSKLELFSVWLEEPQQVVEVNHEAVCQKCIQELLKIARGAKEDSSNVKDSDEKSSSVAPRGKSRIRFQIDIEGNLHELLDSGIFEPEKLSIEQGRSSKDSDFVEYVINVKTADKFTAGTDNGVYIQLFGSQGESDTYLLENEPSETKTFQRNQLDTFHLRCKDVSQLNKLRIGTKGGMFSGWALDYVTVQKVNSEDEPLKFTGNCWLETKILSSGNHQEIELFPDLQEEDTEKPVVDDLEEEITPLPSIEVESEPPVDLGESDKPDEKDGKSGAFGIHLPSFRLPTFKRKDIPDDVTDDGDPEEIKTLELKADDSFGNLDDLLPPPMDDDIEGDIVVPSVDTEVENLPDGFSLDDDVDSGLDFDGVLSTEGSVKSVEVRPVVSDEEIDPSVVEDTHIDLKNLNAEEQTYIVKVKTSNNLTAGTYSKVFIYLHGDKGESEELELKDEISGNTSPFSRNQLDVFEVVTYGIGRINKIRIGNDGQGIFGGWNLDYVLVSEKPDGDSEVQPEESQSTMETKFIALTRLDKRKQGFIELYSMGVSPAHNVPLPEVEDSEDGENIDVQGDGDAGKAGFGFRLPSLRFGGKKSDETEIEEPHNSDEDEIIVPDVEGEVESVPAEQSGESEGDGKGGFGFRLPSFRFGGKKESADDVTISNDAEVTDQEIVVPETENKMESAPDMPTESDVDGSDGKASFGFRLPSLRFGGRKNEKSAGDEKELDVGEVDPGEPRKDTSEDPKDVGKSGFGIRLPSLKFGTRGVSNDDGKEKSQVKEEEADQKEESDSTDASGKVGFGLRFPSLKFGKSDKTDDPKEALLKDSGDTELTESGELGETLSDEKSKDRSRKVGFGFSLPSLRFGGKKDGDSDEKEELDKDESNETGQADEPDGSDGKSGFGFRLPQLKSGGKGESKSPANEEVLGDEDVIVPQVEGEVEAEPELLKLDEAVSDGEKSGFKFGFSLPSLKFGRKGGEENDAGTSDDQEKLQDSESDSGKSGFGFNLPSLRFGGKADVETPSGESNTEEDIIVPEIEDGVESVPGDDGVDSDHKGRFGFRLPSLRFSGKKDSGETQSEVNDTNEEIVVPEVEDPVESAPGDEGEADSKAKVGFGFSLPSLKFGGKKNGETSSGELDAHEEEIVLPEIQGDLESAPDQPDEPDGSRRAGFGFTLSSLRFGRNKDTESDIQAEVDPESESIEEDAATPKGEQKTYIVKVKTSNNFTAGTYSKVFIYLFGDKGESEKLELKDEISGNASPFSRNQLDVFEVSTHDLGQINKIRIGNDGQGIFGGWNLDYVLVSEKPDGDSALESDPIEASSNLVDTKISLKEPSVSSDPVVSLDGPEVSLDGPDVSLSEPVVALDRPEPSLDGPDVSLSGPSLSLDGPEASLDGPNVAFDGPGGTLSGSEISINDPEITLDGPNLSVDNQQETEISIPEQPFNESIDSPNVDIAIPDIDAKDKEIMETKFIALARLDKRKQGFIELYSMGVSPAHNVPLPEVEDAEDVQGDGDSGTTGFGFALPSFRFGGKKDTPEEKESEETEGSGKEAVDIEQSGDSSGNVDDDTGKAGFAFSLPNLKFRRSKKSGENDDDVSDEKIVEGEEPDEQHVDDADGKAGFGFRLPQLKFGGKEENKPSENVEVLGDEDVIVPQLEGEVEAEPELPKLGEPASDGEKSGFGFGFRLPSLGFGTSKGDKVEDDQEEPSGEIDSNEEIVVPEVEDPVESAPGDEGEADSKAKVGFGFRLPSLKFGGNKDKETPSDENEIENEEPNEDVEETKVDGDSSKGGFRFRLPSLKFGGSKKELDSTSEIEGDVVPDEQDSQIETEAPEAGDATDSNSSSKWSLNLSLPSLPSFKGSGKAGADEKEKEEDEVIVPEVEGEVESQPTDVEGPDSSSTSSSKWSLNLPSLPSFKGSGKADINDGDQIEADPRVDSPIEPKPEDSVDSGSTPEGKTSSKWSLNLSLPSLPSFKGSAKTDADINEKDEDNETPQMVDDGELKADEPNVDTPNTDETSSSKWSLNLTSLPSFKGSGKIKGDDIEKGDDTEQEKEEQTAEPNDNSKTSSKWGLNLNLPSLPSFKGSGKAGVDEQDEEQDEVIVPEVEGEVESQPTDVEGPDSSSTSSSKWSLNLPSLPSFKRSDREEDTVSGDAVIVPETEAQVESQPPDIADPDDISSSGKWSLNLSLPSLPSFKRSSKPGDSDEGTAEPKDDQHIESSQEAPHQDQDLGEEMIIPSTESNVESGVPLLLDEETKSPSRGFSFRFPTFEIPRFRGSGDVEVKADSDEIEIMELKADDSFGNLDDLLPLHMDDEIEGDLVIPTTEARVETTPFSMEGIEIPGFYDEIDNDDGKTEEMKLPKRTKPLVENEEIAPLSHQDDSPIEMNNLRAEERNYLVRVKTGDRLNSGTSANIYIFLVGESSTSEKIELKTSRTHKRPFKRSQLDEFIVTTYDVGKVVKIVIGHDGKSLFSAWGLDYVLVSHPEANLDDTNESVGNLEADDIDPDSPPLRWMKFDAETRLVNERNNEIELYGYGWSPIKHKEKTPKIELDLDENEGKVDKKEAEPAEDSPDAPADEISGEESSKPRGGFGFSLRLPRFSSSSSPKDDDSLDSTDESITADDDVIASDGIEESQHAKPKKQKRYSVKVTTKDKLGSGTDSRVYIVIHGNKGETKKLRLKKSRTFKKPFQRNQEDVFEVNPNDVGIIDLCRVSHDGKGFFSAWELDHVTIIDHHDNHSVYHGNADTEVSKHFELHVPMFLQPKENQNLDGKQPIVSESDEEIIHPQTDFIVENTPPSDSLVENEHPGPTDGQIISSLSGDKFNHDFSYGIVTYKIIITTEYNENDLKPNLVPPNDETNVYIVLIGSRQTSEKLVLLQRPSDSPNAFSSRKVDIFFVDQQDVGDISRIRIGADKIYNDWQINKIEVSVPATGSNYVFKLKKPLQAERTSVEVSSFVDGQSSSDSESDDENGETGSVFGFKFPSFTLPRLSIPSDDDKKPGDENPETEKDGEVYTKVAPDSDVPQKVSEELPDNKDGPPSSGFGFRLPTIVLPRFNRTSSSGDDDKEGSELPSTPVDTTKTKPDSKTPEMSSTIEPRSQSDVKPANKPRGFGSILSFRKKKTYTLNDREADDLKIVSHPDNEGTQTSDEEVNAESLREPEDLIEPEISTNVESSPDIEVIETTEYLVHIITGDKRGAGTDADVFIVFIGTKGESDEYKLKNSVTKHKSFFERDQTDSFEVSVSNDIGHLRKIRIRHNNKGGLAPWYLESVILEDIETESKKHMSAKIWLKKKKSLQVELDIPGNSYQLTIYTSDIENAGLDGKIYLRLLGQDAETSEKVVLPGNEVGSIKKKKKKLKELFNRGAEDVFVRKFQDVGLIERIEVGLEEEEDENEKTKKDTKDKLLSWHLDKIVLVRLFTEDEAHASVPVNLCFTCNCWFSTNKNMGQKNCKFFADNEFQPESPKRVFIPTAKKLNLDQSDASEMYYSAPESPSSIRRLPTKIETFTDESEHTRRPDANISTTVTEITTTEVQISRKSPDVTRTEADLTESTTEITKTEHGGELTLDESTESSAPSMRMNISSEDETSSQNIMFVSMKDVSKAEELVTDQNTDSPIMTSELQNAPTTFIIQTPSEGERVTTTIKEGEEQEVVTTTTTTTTRSSTNQQEEFINYEEIIVTEIIEEQINPDGSVTRTTKRSVASPDAGEGEQISAEEYQAIIGQTCDVTEETTVETKEGEVLSVTTEKFQKSYEEAMDDAKRESRAMLEEQEEDG
uniref:PLAT domain-containing protein n=1 Tax=Clytia hemisphaerica TaxID=252671 RepID=A0A7M5WMU0_9CNID